MNTKQYLYMTTIAECGYLSASAKRLNISQAALSKFLKSMEDYLGVELFIRHKKKLYPTIAGTIFLETAQQILSSKNQTLGSINRIKANYAPEIKVAVTPYRGAAIFGQVYSKFVSVFPSIGIKMEETFSSEQETKIHRGITNFAMGTGCHCDYSNVYNLPISREELVLVVPSFHPAAKMASKDLNNLTKANLRDFGDMPFCLLTKKNNIRIIAEKLFEEAGFYPVISFESDNSIALDSMIRRGIGVGIISRRYVREDENVVYFRLDPYSYEITYLRYQTGHIFTDIEKYFCNLMIRERIDNKNHFIIYSPKVSEFMRNNYNSLGDD
ncbi:LysR family transcriptional regulator [Fusobacterium sp. PH5-44]|uniref:LysR family transcriptional regulator n=1 Tax=unclassified Fusobacterium TaxID=2648384 RepID=UPI003D1E9466